MPRARKPLGPVPESVMSMPRPDRMKLSEWLRKEVEAGRLPRRYFDKKTTRLMADRCLDHHRANGNRAGIVDWPAAIRNWFRKQAEIDGERRQERRELYRYEHPQEERGPRDGELTLVWGGKR